MTEIVDEGGVKYLRTGSEMFALPVVEAIPLSKDDRERAKLIGAQEYRLAHKDKMSPGDHAYFLLRYEAELVQMKSSMLRAASVMRAEATKLVQIAGEL